MSTDQELMAQILSDPEADEPRLQFADRIRASEPRRAGFIVSQIEKAARCVQERKSFYNHVVEEPIIEQFGVEWAGTLDRYTNQQALEKRLGYHRGFVMRVCMNPYLFLERADRVFKLAPIRHVRFGYADDGTETEEDQGPMPVEELASCPALAQLDSIAFGRSTRQRREHIGVTDADIDALAKSPYLTRCLYLDLRDTEVTSDVWQILAASPNTRRLLTVECTERVWPKLEFPGQYWEPDGYGRDNYMPMRAEGVALERKYGYIPWLHPKAEACDLFLARAFVDRGYLPTRQPGSPVPDGRER